MPPFCVGSLQHWGLHLPLQACAVPCTHRAEGRNLQVGNVEYVEREEAPRGGRVTASGMPTNKWANAWRQRRASKPSAILPLLAKDGESSGAGA